MASPLIEYTFSAAETHSPAVMGYELGRNEPHNYAGVRNTGACFQAAQTAGTDASTWTLSLQEGIRRADGSIHWYDAKTITNADHGKVEDVVLHPGAMYRIRCSAMTVETTRVVGLFN